MKLSDLTQEVYTRDGEEFQAAVEERIRPFGDVYLPGEEQQAAAPTVDTVEVAEPVATVMSGPQVYNNACVACHAAGVAGAPILGDAAGWTDRIAKGMDTLNNSAINGIGVMPAKGGSVMLSDDEVIAAVEYMVSESR